MIKRIFRLVVISTILASTSASAAVILTFEGVGNTAAIQNFYNGGTDSQGHSGTNYGITFSPNALGIQERLQGGTGNFQNEPSPKTVLFFQTGSQVTLNNSVGFDTGFSFFYSSSVAGTVKVFDDVNGTGNLLATLNFSAQNRSNCAAGSTQTYCNFSPVGVTFTGIGKSIDFGASAANATGFDDITFGSAVAGGPTQTVPEPTTLALLGLGLAGFVVAQLKAKK